VSAPKKAKPLTAAGRKQLADELSETERADAAVKASTDPGEVSVTLRAKGWRRGLHLTLEIPPDD
jgi:hypothetical protein